MSATRFTLWCALIAAIVFAAVAPTLRWLEFSSGSENLVVETVLEMHRGGPWLIPTLDDAPRTNKPPLPAWICAAFVRPATIASLSDVSKRDAAYSQLAWQVRWPAVIFACLAIVACGWIGRILISDGVGISAAGVMASSAIFLRFGRSMTTDVHLLLWVTIANAFFALAMFKRRRWLGCVLGGIALGLALMSKGPVALAQTIVPIALFYVWRTLLKKPRQPLRILWPHLAAAAMIVLAIAVPWPAYAFLHVPGQMHRWVSELAQGGNSDYVADPPWAYWSFIPLMLPWAAFFFVGLIVLLRRKNEEGMFVILLALAPIVVMSFFTEKNERYLLPMIAPTAIICAVGVLAHENHVARLRDYAAGFTWVFLLLVAIGLPIAGAHLMRDVHGAPWYSLRLAILSGIGLSACVLAAWRLDSQGRYNFIPTGLLVMLLANMLFTYGYAKSDRGVSDGRPIADAIVAQLPPGVPVWAFTETGRFSRIPVDTTIYLDRVVHPTTNPAALSNQPQAVLIHARKDQSIPPALHDWRMIGATSKNNGVWHACIPPGM